MFVASIPTPESVTGETGKGANVLSERSSGGGYSVMVGRGSVGSWTRPGITAYCRMILRISPRKFM